MTEDLQNVHPQLSIWLRLPRELVADSNRVTKWAPSKSLPSDVYLRSDYSLTPRQRSMFRWIALMNCTKHSQLGPLFKKVLGDMPYAEFEKALHARQYEKRKTNKQKKQTPEEATAEAPAAKSEAGEVKKAKGVLAAA